MPKVVKRDMLPLTEYDYIIVSYSGGKDSVACYLQLLEQGVDPSRIELWHNHVDGAPGSELFFDWPITEAYCRAFAESFGSQLYFSWREGGINREMHRDNTPTAGVTFEHHTDEGEFTTTALVGSPQAKPGIRRKFPQVTANLSQRFCSAAAKIDVASRAITNQPRFKGKQTLFITGERAQESTARANYNITESHRNDVKSRFIDAWRPVHSWDERAVWDIMQRHNVRAHPAYELGFGRVSCFNCIFASKDQQASIKVLDPERFEWVCSKEEEFGFTIQRKDSWRETAPKGTPYPAILANPEIAAMAMSKDYHVNIRPTKWTLPAGAFGEATGPT